MTYTTERNCGACGKAFTPHTGRAKFCSHACRDEARRVRVGRRCVHCGTAFAVKPWQLRQAGHKHEYCSRLCANQRSRSTPEKFWARVNKTGGCWLWTGGKSTAGYGTFGQPTQFAHRLSYAMHFGPIPKGMEVCHRCDTPACIRPDHLFLGTHADNMADMAAKGRAKRRPA